MDPLNLTKKEFHPELDYKSYGLKDSDLEKDIFIDNVSRVKNRSELEVELEKTFSKKTREEWIKILDTPPQSLLMFFHRPLLFSLRSRGLSYYR